MVLEKRVIRCVGRTTIRYQRGVTGVQLIYLKSTLAISHILCYERELEVEAGHSANSSCAGTPSSPLGQDFSSLGSLGLIQEDHFLEIIPK